jgi:hypothetical protein
VKTPWPNEMQKQGITQKAEQILCGELPCEVGEEKVRSAFLDGFKAIEASLLRVIGIIRKSNS